MTTKPKRNDGPKPAPPVAPSAAHSANAGHDKSKDPPKSAPPVTPSTAHPANAPATSQEEKVRRLAYQKWEAAGRPDCDGISFWLEAERDCKSTN
jgi:Protein of unknown function (DUF2934)